MDLTNLLSAIKCHRRLQIKNAKDGDVMSGGSSIPKFYESPLTEEKAGKIVKYLKAGWKLSIAMSQCNIDANYKHELLKRLEDLGVTDYRV